MPKIIINDIIREMTEDEVEEAKRVVADETYEYVGDVNG